MDEAEAEEDDEEAEELAAPGFLRYAATKLVARAAPADELLPDNVAAVAEDPPAASRAFLSRARWCAAYKADGAGLFRLGATGGR